MPCILYPYRHIMHPISANILPTTMFEFTPFFVIFAILKMVIHVCVAQHDLMLLPTTMTCPNTTCFYTIYR